MWVKPKKHLGQHFLTDLSIANKIVDSLQNKNNVPVLEIGPGMGVLSDFLLKTNQVICLMDIDTESINYLQQKYKAYSREKLEIIEADFLQINLHTHFLNQFVVIGNFPYNISSQILFKVLENKEMVPEVVGMFQKEVAERICSKPGSKVYGILSVLIQAFYSAEYLFTVNEEVFNPPPKVKSGVLRLTKKENEGIEINQKLLFQVVKTAFNQRRKKLRNAIKIFLKEKNNQEIENYLEKRAEQLSVEDFLHLTKLIETVH